MIKVTYEPSDGNWTKEFETLKEFEVWLKSYVCKWCHQDAKDIWNEELKTIRDYLSTGCGCELIIEDENNLI